MSILRKTVDWFEERLSLSEIFSWITTFGISYAPLNPNLPIRKVVRDAFLKPIPYFQLPQVLGILTFVTFLLEVLTGFLLIFYYQPEPTSAYESTLLIVRGTNFGWYIYQMHFWGSHVLIALLAIRLLRFVFQRIYTPPRELFWVFGVLLLLTSIQASLTGNLLPWNQASYWGTIRSLELLNEIPFFGAFLSYFTGGFLVHDFLLLRFYILHILILPGCMFVLFYLLFATLRRVGLSPVPPDEASVRPLFPGHLLNLLMMLFALFGIILTLGVLLPTPFLAKADPFHTPGAAPIPWYMLALYGVLEVSPAIGGWIILIGLWILILLPVVDQQLEKRLKRIWLVKTFSIAFMLIILIATYWGYRNRG